MMFIELTGIAYMGTDDEYHYTFLLNKNHIESIQMEQWGAKIFMVNDDGNEYKVCETAQEIVKMCKED